MRSQPLPERPELERLLASMKGYVMTEDERFEQAVSWVYGQIAMSNPEATREQAAEAVSRAWGRVFKAAEQNAISGQKKGRSVDSESEEDLALVEAVAKEMIGPARWAVLPEKATYLQRKGAPEAEWWDREELRDHARDVIKVVRDHDARG